MTVATASLLAQAAQGAVKKGWHRSSSTAQRLALQTLINQGLVEVERNGDVGITCTVRLGFVPDGVARPR